MKKTDILLTPQEAADILRLTKKHVLDLCRDGTIPSLKMGMSQNSPIRISASELDKYLKAAAR